MAVYFVSLEWTAVKHQSATVIALRKVTRNAPRGTGEQRDGRWEEDGGVQTAMNRTDDCSSDSERPQVGQRPPLPGSPLPGPTSDHHSVSLIIISSRPSSSPSALSEEQRKTRNVRNGSTAMNFLPHSLTRTCDAASLDEACKQERTVRELIPLVLSAGERPHSYHRKCITIN